MRGCDSWTLSTEVSTRLVSRLIGVNKTIFIPQSSRSQVQRWQALLYARLYRAVAVAIRAATNDTRYVEYYA